MRKDTIRAFFRINVFKVVVTTLLLMFAPSFMFLAMAVGTYPALNILRLPFLLSDTTVSGGLWILFASDKWILFAVCYAQFVVYLFAYYSLSCWFSMTMRNQDALRALVIIVLIVLAVVSTQYPIYFICDAGGGRHIMKYAEVLEKW